MKVWSWPLVKALKRTFPGQLSLFEENLHPRFPAGTSGKYRGGEFSPRLSGTMTLHGKTVPIAVGQPVGFTLPDHPQGRENSGEVVALRVNDAGQVAGLQVVKRHSKTRAIISRHEVPLAHVKRLGPAHLSPEEFQREETVSSWIKTWPDSNSVVQVNRPDGPEAVGTVLKLWTEKKKALVQFPEGLTAVYGYRDLKPEKGEPFTPVAVVEMPLDRWRGYEVKIPSGSHGILTAVLGNQAVVKLDSRSVSAKASELVPYIPREVLREAGQPAVSRKKSWANLLQETLSGSGEWPSFLQAEEELYEGMKREVWEAATNKAAGFMALDPANAFGDVVAVANLGWIIGNREYEWAKRQGKLEKQIGNSTDETSRRHNYIMRRVYHIIRGFLSRGEDLINLPAKAKQMTRKVDLVASQLYASSGQRPTDEELARVLKIEPEEVVKYRRYQEEFIRPAYERAFAEFTAGEEVPLADLVPIPNAEQPEEIVVSQDWQEQAEREIKGAIAALPETARKIFMLRWHKGWPFERIGSYLGLSPTRAKMVFAETLAGFKAHPRLRELYELRSLGKSLGWVWREKKWVESFLCKALEAWRTEPRDELGNTLPAWPCRRTLIPQSSMPGKRVF